MSSEKIISERPITLAELADDLDKLEKEEKELNFRSNKTKAYLNHFKKLDMKQVKEITKKIEDLEIPRLKERQVVKLIDSLPKTEEEIKLIFVGETTTVTEENTKKLLEVIKEYVKKK
jgi:DNA-directed RNA polymerase subunit F